ncbi:19280_t:CDS:2, partial [Racocetra fulgida]
NYYNSSIDLSSNSKGHPKTNSSESNVNETNSNNVTEPTDPEFDYDEYKPDGKKAMHFRPHTGKHQHTKIEINTSNHYKLFILITSQVKEFRKRNLLRDILFGIESNLEP